MKLVHVFPECQGEEAAKDVHWRTFSSCGNSTRGYPLEEHVDFQITPDWVSAVADSVTAIAAATAAFQGIKSLNAWRGEAIGRRQFEVAEDVLATFYTMQDVIYQVRAPLVLAAEMQTEEGLDDRIATDADYAPLRRLSRHQQTISEFRSKRPVFAAIFGKEKTEPFQEIERILIEIKTAVEARLEGKRAGLPNRGDADYEFYREMSRIIFRFPGKDKDPITPRVEGAVKSVEEICEPVIRARLTKKP
jgi:hypothetical protein